MCGIAGYVGDAELGRPLVERMNALQQRRGPDGVGLWADSNVVLGHTRLAVLDLSDAAAQPMHSETWALTFNGEIYNYRELRAELPEYWRPGPDSGDTAVLFACLHAYGLNRTLPMLNGMFAFAAYDRKAGSLYLARDRLGIKPLAWSRSARGFAFASNVAALVGATDETRPLNLNALVDYLRLGAPFGDATFFTGVQRVPPASAIEWNGSEIREWTWWRPKPRDDCLADVLENAVRIRLEADVDVGLLLSGGVDSTLLAALSPTVRCFHLDSRTEADHAKAVAQALGHPLEVVDAPVVDVDLLMTDYVRFSGEPAIGAPIPSLVCRAVRRSAVVAISANGADELFFGYRRTLGPRQKWHVFRRNLSLGPGMPPLGPLSVSPLETVAEFPEDSGAAASWFELQTYIRYDLNPVLDYASMMWGVEARVPFLDHRVVERAMTLPLYEKVDPSLGDAEGGRKAPLKRLIPQFRAQWDRRKRGFSLPKSAEHGPRRDACIRAALRRGFVRSIDCPGASGRDRLYLSRSLWALEHWMRVWLDTGKVEWPG